MRSTWRFKWLLLTALLLTFLAHSVLGSPCFKFYAPETTHTVVLPFERSIIFKARLSNVGDEELFVGFSMPEAEPPEDWLTILPSGIVWLPPGEEVDVIATFEPTVTAEGGRARWTLTSPCASARRPTSYPYTSST